MVTPRAGEIISIISITSSANCKNTVSTVGGASSIGSADIASSSAADQIKNSLRKLVVQEFFCAIMVLMTEVVRTPKKRGPKPGFGTKGERDAFTVRVPKGLRDRLKALSAAKGYQSTSDLVSELLVDWVPREERELSEKLNTENV